MNWKEIKTIIFSTNPPEEIILNNDDFVNIVNQARNDTYKHSLTDFDAFIREGEFCYSGVMGIIKIRQEILPIKKIYNKPFGILDLTKGIDNAVTIYFKDPNDAISK